MNTLAPVLPSTSAGPTAAKSNKPGNDAPDNAFADRMAQALDEAMPPRDNDAAAAEDAEHQPESDDTSSAESATTASATTAAPAAGAPTPAAAPDLAALLPGWATPTTSLPAAQASGESDEAADALAPAVSAAVPAAHDIGSASAFAATANAPRSEEAAMPALAAADKPTRATTEARTTAPDSATTATPLSGAPQPTLAPAARAAEHAAPTAHIPTPLHTPAFAPALATQVRWWAQDGVQQAQLTLNPPEMGPVAVRIVVTDGRDARIDFSADLAATRGAIEAALPVLAAALDESGLKLAGGGVHDGAAQRQALWQQSQQQQRNGVTQLTRGNGAAAGGDMPSMPQATRPVSGRGLVDLVA